MLPLIALLACQAPSEGPHDTATHGEDTAAQGGDSGDSGEPDDTGGTGDTGDTADTAGTSAPDPFADAVASFAPGTAAGFGQDAMPDVVLGPPQGGGVSSGSLDVVSLGCEGVIVLAFEDIGLVDGDGPDLLVFENPFSGYVEPGRVAVSEDGETWSEWPCETTEPYTGCAGLQPVLSDSDNGFDPTDPATAGGDAFDLADLGLSSARFVRITDAGLSDCVGTSAGFDLDALAVVNGEPLR